MNTRLRLLAAVCLTVFAKPAGAVGPQSEMIKIAERSNDIYAHAAAKPQQLDFRLAYIDKALLDQLVSQGEILVDTTGMLKREQEVGIYRMKLVSDSVPVVFTDLIRITGFVHKRYPVSVLVQEGRAVRQSPKFFLTDDWKDAKLKPGDIIVLMGE